MPSFYPASNQWKKDRAALYYNAECKTADNFLRKNFPNILGSFTTGWELIKAR